MTKEITLGVNPNGVLVPIADIVPLKYLKPTTKCSLKYRQVLASVSEIGVIEPLIVFPKGGESSGYFLLDGHVRLEALKQIGTTHVRCLMSTDDEAYTYNKRVNRVATIQEHKMILSAIKNGVSEDRIAKVLNVDITKIRQKRDLLEGICKEAAEILKTEHMSHKIFWHLRKMKPVRQIEVAELLAASNNFTIPYVKALVAATRQEMLVEPDKSKIVEGLSPEQISRMEREMEVLQRDLKSIEQNYGNEMLNLVLAKGYLTKLFNNAKILRYLSQHSPDILEELRLVSKEAQHAA